ncbi:hypothetical protein Q8F55_002766 [Vanrija albida]|uniref:Uncharacterized protein n=1 Tax=Vanrija albida TaxID=181172 RepID=A0ABR3QAR3_9TREE
MILALILLFLLAARAQDLVLHPITNATTGRALTITWTGGVPPYDIAVLDFADTVDLALLTTTDIASGIEGNSYPWTVVGVGALQIRLSDSVGSVVSSAVFPVLNLTASTSASVVTSTAASTPASTPGTIPVGTIPIGTIPASTTRLTLAPTATFDMNDHGMSQATVNQIIGGVLGGFVILVILLAVAVWHFRHRRPGHPAAMLHVPDEKVEGDPKPRRGSALSNGSSFFSGLEEEAPNRPSLRSISAPLPLRTGSRADTNSYVSHVTYEDGTTVSERGPSRASAMPMALERSSLDGPRLSLDSFYSNPDAIDSMRSASGRATAGGSQIGSQFNSTSSNSRKLV